VSRWDLNNSVEEEALHLQPCACVCQEVLVLLIKTRTTSSNNARNKQEGTFHFRNSRLI